MADIVWVSFNPVKLYNVNGAVGMGRLSVSAAYRMHDARFARCIHLVLFDFEALEPFEALGVPLLIVSRNSESDGQQRFVYSYVQPEDAEMIALLLSWTRLKYSEPSPSSRTIPGVRTQVRNARLTFRRAGQFRVWTPNGGTHG